VACPLSANARRKFFQALPNTRPNRHPDSAITATTPFAISPAFGRRVGAWGSGCPCKSQGSSDKIPRRACQKPSRNPPETNYGFSVQSRKQPKTRGGEKALART
jgi:hypothetical protein